MRKLGITAISSLLLFMLGCAQNEDRDTAIINNKKNVITVNDPSNSNYRTMTGEQIAEHLVALATSIPDVKDATAVVAGNYAVVGIDVNKDLERSRVGSIKYSVAESLKNDPYGANAVVVADADTIERLKQMRKEIKNGRPISGVMEELAAIVGRVMPEIPYHLNKKEGPNEQNDKQLQQNEKNQLDQIQTKQSKGNM